MGSGEPHGGGPGRSAQTLPWPLLRRLPPGRPGGWTLCRVAKSQTELKRFSMQAFIIIIFTCLEHM